MANQQRHQFDYAIPSTWSDDAAGFNGSQRTHAAGIGDNVATWTRDSLTADAYEVFATWSTDASAATNATHEVFDGTTSLGTFSVDQTAAPTGTSIAGQAWERLGIFEINSGTLQVELSDNANGAVLADAIRLVPHAIPTTSGLPDIWVAEDSSDTLIDLSLYFDDVDIAGGDSLTYSVVSVDVPSLAPNGIVPVWRKE